MAYPDNMLAHQLRLHEQKINDLHEYLDKQLCPRRTNGIDLSLTQRMEFLGKERTREDVKMRESLYQTISEAHDFLSIKTVPKIIFDEAGEIENTTLISRLKCMVDRYEGELNTVYQEKSNAHEVGAQMYLGKCKEVSNLQNEVNQLQKEKFQLIQENGKHLEEIEKQKQQLSVLYTDYNKLLDLLA